MAKKPTGVNHRSSETGRYTTQKKAEAKPKEHEAEKRKPPKK